MIMKLVGALLGRKVKEQAVGVILSKVDLPDPVENAIKAAATGNVGSMVADLTKKTKK
jgi:hypothetical protein